MKKPTLVLYSVSLVAFVLSLLFVINYFTCFGYYLPHKPQVVYMATDDISVHSKPMFIAIDDWGDGTIEATQQTPQNNSEIEKERPNHGTGINN
jgi:hypothetical protein